MLFCSQTFLLFFLAVFAAYWALPWHRARVWLLLGASIYFYADWSRWLAALVVGTACLDYLIARLLDATAGPRRRKALLALSVGMNLGVLGYFKYVNFFLHSLEQMLARAGVHESMPVLSVIVPIGISFYTFEAISYVVDVYRRQLRAERSLVNFLVFILFFPHLIAGPIVRARDFLPQVRRKKRWNWLRMQAGLQLCLLGLFKKLAIADRMALFADPVFADPELFRTSALWLALVAYVIQIYCDFSGYSDLAMGTAHLLGYRLCWNFNLPYLAPNISEFWRRWHISLGSWMRDYVFFPLGGSRCSALKTSRNLLVVMMLCGLWHGAAWRFVVFGLLQGAWLSGHMVFRRWCAGRPRLKGLLETAPGTALRVAGTLTLFALTLVIFRCATVGQGLGMLRGLLFRHAGKTLPLQPVSLGVLAALLVAGYALAADGRWRRWLDTLPAPVRGIGLGLTASLALLLAPDAGQAFLYFDF